MHRGLTLRFHPIDRRLRYEAGDIRDLITPRTKAIYVIHYLGVPQPLDDIQKFARREVFVSSRIARSRFSPSVKTLRPAPSVALASFAYIRRCRFPTAVSWC